MTPDLDRVLVSTRVRSPGSAPGYRPAALGISGARFRTVVELPTELDRRRRAVAELAGTAPIEDHGDRPITPAFVNAHTHLALAFLRGPAVGGAARGNLVEDLFFRLEARLGPDDVRAFTRMGAYESLLAGVGLVWDHYYFGEAVADALLDVGLTGVVAPTLQDLEGPGRDGWRAALEATEALAMDRRRHDLGVHAALGPHATDTVSGALFRRSLELAERHGLPLHLHLAQSAEEVARVRAREAREPLPWLKELGVLDEGPSAVVLAHGLFVRRSHLDDLDPARHALVFCPSAQAAFGFPAPVRRWASAGVRFVVATDSAAGNDSMSLQKELRLVAAARTADVAASDAFAAHFDGADGAPTEAAVRALRAGRMTNDAALGEPAALLDRVWASPGALHPALSAGTLAPGALANAIVWDPTHPSFWPGGDLDRGIAYGDTLGAMHSLYVAGRPVGETGDVAALCRSEAYREARTEADRRLAALWKRAQ